MAQQIQLRRGTQAEWTTANPILAVGEVGIEIDTNKIKIGSGAAAWNSLPYFAGGGAGGSGATVTSVNGTGANGVSVTGGPITGAGSLTIGLGNITPASINASGAITGSNLSGTNTGDQTITLTGDITGSGSSSFTTTLATVNPNVGSHGSSTLIPTITVDSKGRITSVSTNAFSIGVATVNGRSGTVSLTSTDVGLGNCDNTADLNKPLSTAQSVALATKNPNLQFQDEGSNVGTSGSINTVNFVGTGITASSAGGTLTVTSAGLPANPSGGQVLQYSGSANVWANPITFWNITTATPTFTLAPGFNIIRDNFVGNKTVTIASTYDCYYQINTESGSGTITIVTI